MDNDIKILYDLIKRGSISHTDAAEQMKLLISRQRQSKSSPPDKKSMNSSNWSKDANSASLEDRIRDGLRQTVAGLLNVKLSDVDENEHFGQLGIDRLMLNEFANRLNAELKLEINPEVFNEYSTLSDLGQHLSIEYRDILSDSILAEEEETLFETKEGNAVSIVPKDLIREKTAEHLKELLSSVAKMQVGKIDEDAQLEKYGINSITIIEITNQLEKTFGQLSKTLFFEYQTISELTGYFVEAYGDKLVELLGIRNEKRAVSESREQVAAVRPVKPAAFSRRHPRFLPTEAVMPQTEAAETTDIAVIGLTGRYPGANSIDEFWDVLREGKDCITEIPEERWDHSLYFDENRNIPGKTNCKWGGFLKEIDRFDPMFFNILPREAEVIDPMARLFLETTWNLLEGTGYTKEKLQVQHQSRVGVYVGAMYQQYNTFDSDIVNEAAAMVSSYSSMANRVSHFFDLQGPSVAIDTMCSSSTVAIHMACENLSRGDCEMAIVGGVNLSIHPKKYIGLALSGVLGSSADSRSFSDGDGYLPAEGVGAVLLKPLKNAVQDRDNILAVIKATAINHSGHTNGYMVPNPNAQAQLIEDNFKKSGIDPRTISYVEAAANGSKLGDPIEINALSKAFRKYTDNLRFCAIGSVKSNIGHAEAASGMAQLTKVILQLQHKKLVPSIKAKRLNPNIDFESTPFYLQSELVEWKRPKIQLGEKENEFPRRATISSFGAGGSNAHLILEEFMGTQEKTVNSDFCGSPQVIVFSARNKSRLDAVVRQMFDFIEPRKEISIQSLAYTLQLGREAMEYRLAMIVNNHEELIKGMKQYLEAVWENRQVESSIPVFTGNVEDGCWGIGGLLSGKIGETVLQMLLEERNYEKIALHWTQGGRIPWEQLHQGLETRNIALPTYPFERKRYWITKGAKLLIDMTAPEKPENILSGSNPHLGGIRNRISEISGIPVEELTEKKTLNNLGFSSIQVVTLRSIFEKDFNTEIPISVFDMNSTIEALEDNLKGITCKTNEKQLDADMANDKGQIMTVLSGTPDILPEIIPDPDGRYEPFPLNDIQESFLTGRMLRFGGDWVGCHVYFEMEINELEIYRLNKAWNQLVSHHEMLRTMILSEGKQRILEEVPAYRFKTADLRIRTEKERTAHMENVRKSMSHKVYKADLYPMFEIRVSIHPENKYIVHFSIDELIADASAIHLLLKQWEYLYKNPGMKLPELEVSFRDYILALKKFEHSKRYRNDIEYWVRKLGYLPQGPVLSSKQNKEGANLFFRSRLNTVLEEKEWNNLKNKARELEVSPTALLLSIFSEFLRIKSGNERFSLLLTFFNRLPLHPQLSRIVAPFIATNIFVVDGKAGRSLETLVKNNQKSLWNDLEHMSASGIKVLRELKSRRITSGSLYLPIVFTSLVNNFEAESSGDKENFFRQISFMVTQTPQVYLDHQVYEQDGKLMISWDVAKDYFAPGLIDEMFSDYCRVLKVLSTQDIPWTFDQLTSGSSMNALCTSNLTDKDLPEGLLLEVSETERYKPYPLTDQQQAYAFGRSSLISGGGKNCMFYQEIDIENLDVIRLENAWKKLMMAHDMLVTVIRQDGTQRTLEEVPDYRIEVTELAQGGDAEIRNKLNEIKDNMLENVFELDKWPYFDLRVTTLNNNKSRVHFCIDMLIADGNSIHILLEQLVYFYENPKEEPEKLGVSFRDYVLSLIKYRRTEGYKKSLRYWEDKFAEISQGPQLAVENESMSLAEREQYNGTLRNWPALKRVAEDMGVSPGIILLTAYAEVFEAWLGHEPFSIVVPSWKRIPLHPDIPRVVGDFTAMNWVETKPGKKAFKEKVLLNHKTVEKDLSHMDVSGLKALRKVLIRGGDKGMLTFPVVFTNLFEKQGIKLPENFKMGEKVSKTPQVYIDNISQECGGGLDFHWDVLKGAYSGGMVEEMFKGYVRVLEALAENDSDWNNIDFEKLIDAKHDRYMALRKVNSRGQM